MPYLPAPEPFRKLGKSGIGVSSIAWGMWRFGGEGVAKAQAQIEAVLEAGVTLFDTADVYRPKGDAFGTAETVLGQVLKAQPELRQSMVLATKGGIALGVPYDSSADYLTAAIDASLQRLGCEHIDLWQIHRPDILTHPAEIARAVEDAQKAGKIGALGLSNFTPAQTETLMAFLDLPVVSQQPEFSALKLDPITDGTLDQAIRHDMAVLCWSPLGGGRIANPADPRAEAVASALDIKAAEAGVSRAATAYSWLMAHPARPIPIVGTQNLQRIRELPDVYKPRWSRRDWYGVLIAARGEKLP